MGCGGSKERKKKKQNDGIKMRESVKNGTKLEAKIVLVGSSSCRYIPNSTNVTWTPVIFKHLEDRNIKCAAAEIKHNDFLIFLFIESVCQSRRGWLVDDALHVQPSDFAGIFGGLSLRIVEILG